jgi:tetratricopeptide (TPR) repeat protein
MVKVALLAHFFSVSLAAAAPPQTAVDPAASTYERLLQRYTRGDYSGAVEEALRHSAWEFDGPFEDALARVEYRLQFETVKFNTFDEQNPEAMYRARDEFVRLVLAAMLLHTEAAFKTTDTQASIEIRFAQRARTALLVAERYLQGKPWPGSKTRRSPVSSGAGHFTTADVDRARHDWVVLVAVGFHARARLDALEKYLADALKQYPRDPALELCLGVYYERKALADTVDASLVHELYSSDDERRWRRRLELAIAAFGEVPNGSDLSQEAHLRVGHSRAVLGDAARARSELEPLTGQDRGLPIQYLALLALGAVDEAEGKRDAAEARYRDAMARFPTAQAPMLAVSRLHDEAGDTRGAGEWMERSFALPADGRVDPWWSYYTPFIDRDALVTSLRQQVHR